MSVCKCLDSDETVSVNAVSREVSILTRLTSDLIEELRNDLRVARLLYEN